MNEKFETASSGTGNWNLERIQQKCENILCSRSFWLKYQRTEWIIDRLILFCEEGRKKVTLIRSSTTLTVATKQQRLKFHLSSMLRKLFTLVLSLLCITLDCKRNKSSRSDTLIMDFSRKRRIHSYACRWLYLATIHRDSKRIFSPIRFLCLERIIDCSWEFLFFTEIKKKNLHPVTRTIDEPTTILYMWIKASMKAHD